MLSPFRRALEALPVSLSALLAGALMSCSSNEPPAAAGGAFSSPSAGAAPNGMGGASAGTGTSEGAAAGSVGVGGSSVGGSPSGGRSAAGESGVSPAAGAGGASPVAGAGGAGPVAGAGGASPVAGAGGSGEVPDASGTRQAAYYVSPTGSDDNPGSASQPFRSLSKARDVVRAISSKMTGDIYVYLRGGTFEVAAPITFTPADSGTNEHRIHYQAYPGEKPALSGAVKVTGFTAHSGGIYKAPLQRTTKLRNLYVNDARAAMTRKQVTSRGGQGTYAVTAGQASWAWVSGSKSDGAKYNTSDIPPIASNKDDLEIVNGTTWNENIVCVRDVVTTTDNFRALLFQQPYGAIAQLPGWSSGFSVTGTHTVYNAYEWLNGPGQFYFDKTTQTLYYYPREGESMASADVRAPVTEKLIDIAGASKTNRVKNLTFSGITFENTDYNLYKVEDSRGKATVQGATIYVAYGNGDWHASKYEITDTLPAMITVNNADSIAFVGNVVKHSGSEGISLSNDVINSTISGNFITDIAGSGITVGHPQHVYLGDTSTHAKFKPEVEGICTNNAISNNLFYDVSSAPGFGGHSGITAFFVEKLAVTHNHIQKTAYSGLTLGWGWRNFLDSTTSKNNTVNNNRFIDTLSRLHDSGAVYTLGQMPGTTINENYVRGIPPATSGPTYGLHNDEGSAYITQNDNVLDVDPGVKYTINCEDFGLKHDLTILRTHATVNKMGINPPMSTIDPPVVVADAVWPLAQYGVCLKSGLEDAHQAIVPSSLLSTADYVFPASVAVKRGAAPLDIRVGRDASQSVWFAPASTTSFVEGATMTRAMGSAKSLALPMSAGTYKLFVVDAAGKKVSESSAKLRVE
jgi:hypothetical protein